MTGHFSRYSGGLPGAGLLILRGTVGVMAVSQGFACAPLHGNGASWMWTLTLLMCLGGGALLLGVLTVVCSLAIGLAEMGLACSFLATSTLGPYHTETVPILAVVMSAAISLIGPGAFSIDALLFGPREVKIPQVSRPPDS